MRLLRLWRVFTRRRTDPAVLDEEMAAHLRRWVTFWDRREAPTSLALTRVLVAAVYAAGTELMTPVALARLRRSRPKVGISLCQGPTALRLGSDGCGNDKNDNHSSSRPGSYSPMTKYSEG